MKIDIEEIGNICEEGLKYYASFETEMEAWEKCERADWMLYVAALLNVNTRKLVLAKARCAETVKHLMVDERSIVAIEKAIQFGLGEIDFEKLNDAAADADAAATAAYAAAHAVAADAAAYACAAAAYAAAADAAATAAYAADAAHAAACATRVRKKQQEIMSDICRDTLTEEIKKSIKKLKN